MNKWIPVEERLPEDYSRVLLTVKGVRGIRVRSATYYENGSFNSDNGNMWRVGEKGLIAWMELPKPYKKERTK